MTCKQNGNQVVIEAAPIALALDFPAFDLSTYDGLADRQVIGCVFSGGQPGYEWELQQDDQCLTDDAPNAFLGDEQASEFDFTTAFCAGGTVTEQIEDWAIAQQLLMIRWKFPANAAAANGAERFTTSYIRVWKPDNIEKKVIMKTQVTMLRQDIIRRRLIP